jgi:hypothetical protein
MRFLALFARHPRLRTALVLIAVAAVLWGGARLWTSGPDAVHITITHVDDENRLRPAIKTVTYDRTIPNSTVAQRLQRDLAAMPLADPFATYHCYLGPLPYGTSSIYDAYTLTWYRAGLPVEHASANRTGCAWWTDDGVFARLPVNAEVLYADIAAVVTASG